MRTEDEAPALPKSFLRPCLLLLLREQPAHGYELLERLCPLGFSGDDPGGLYRALRLLERDGLVHSAWEPSQNGPARRIYQLTRAGMEELHRRSKSLVRARETLDVFLSRYGEFVALEERPAALRTR
ncbi:MAG: helix-turn-helix transcriptional regulator [Actinobacteria bacterium]|nr:helix-turn-helix transcriptional regulator [Actinomycetota bacterium]